jgi:hypothetical protein
MLSVPIDKWNNKSEGYMIDCPLAANNHDQSKPPIRIRIDRTAKAG